MTFKLLVGISGDTVTVWTSENRSEAIRTTMFHEEPRETKESYRINYNEDVAFRAA